MDIIVFILFLIIAIAGLVTNIFGLPGNFIILLNSFIYSWYGDFRIVSIKLLVVLLVLALSGELIEFLLGIAGAKKYKSSNRAVAASIIFGIFGAIAGAPFFLGIGSLVGAFIGAFIGAFLVEFLAGHGIEQAFNSGWGTLVGRLGGTISKSIIGMVMIALVAISFINY